MEEVGDALGDVLYERNQAYGQHVLGEYHPSQVSGCPLKVHLNWMTDNETVLNCWLFQGSAVHYYLQESGIMTEALNEAGYHPVHTSYEIPSKKKIDDDISITGKCDIVCARDGETTIFDIKYSSIPPHSGHGRLYKYMSQANTYAHMKGADSYGLIMINSKSRDLLGVEEGNTSDIVVMPGKMSEDNWEIIKQKARNIHEALIAGGWDDGNRWEVSTLQDIGSGFWKDVVAHFDKKQIPSYEDECQYCPHSEYCPVNQGKLGGVKSLISE